MNVSLAIYVCMYVCMYECMCVCIYVRTYVCMCMHVCTYVCICMYACMYVYVCMYVCMYVRMYVYVCIYVCISVYVCMYVCVCMYMYVYICMYVYVCICVCPSATLPASSTMRRAQYNSHRTDVREISYLEFLLKSIHALRFWLQQNKSNIWHENLRTFMWLLLISRAVVSVRYELRSPRSNWRPEHVAFYASTANGLSRLFGDKYRKHISPCTRDVQEIRHLDVYEIRHEKWYSQKPDKQSTI
jgi:hypothetical protein